MPRNTPKKPLLKSNDKEVSEAEGTKSFAAEVFPTSDVEVEVSGKEQGDPDAVNPQLPKHVADTVTKRKGGMLSRHACCHATFVRQCEERLDI